MRFIITHLFLAVLFAGAGASLADTATVPECDTDAISLGGSQKVCGLHQTSPGGDPVNAYLGMSYGKAERWQHSTAYSWNGTEKATAYGAICPQATAYNDSCVNKQPLTQSEDCLSLNIWTPPHAEAGDKLPVLVYIYGGAFIAGNSAVQLFDGSALAAKDVIVVSFNYRLGALGFMAANEPKDGQDPAVQVAGNFGFGDQQLALKWVQDNIGAFGGDKDQVTIFGESAGAMSVGLHAVSAPGSSGMFHAAVMQSNPMGIPYKSPAQATKFFQKLANHIWEWKKQTYFPPTGKWAEKYDLMKNPEKVSFSEIVEHQSLSPKFNDGFSELLVWAPVVDGTRIAQEPIEAIWQYTQATPPSWFRKVPMIIGTNRNEGMLFAVGFNQKLALTKNDYSYMVNTLFLHDIGDDILKQSAYEPEAVPSKYVSRKKHDEAIAHNISQMDNLLTDYLFTCPNQFFLETASQLTDTYGYQFVVPAQADHRLDIWPPQCMENGLVCHGAELPYVFDTLTTNWCKKPKSSAPSRYMVDGWTNFAIGQAPTEDGSWKSYRDSKENMILSSSPAMGSLHGPSPTTDPASNCAWWQKEGEKRKMKPFEIFDLLNNN